MTTKLFHLGDVLSITTKVLLSPRHMDGVHDILEFMTGQVIFDHEAPRVAKDCTPFLLEQHPSLAKINLDAINKNDVDATLEALCAEYGTELLVTALPQHAHEVVNPHSEVAGEGHPGRIIAINKNELLS